MAILGIGSSSSHSDWELTYLKETICFYKRNLAIHVIRGFVQLPTDVTTFHILFPYSISFRDDLTNLLTRTDVMKRIAEQDFFKDRNGIFNFDGYRYKLLGLQYRVRNEHGLGVIDISVNENEFRSAQYQDWKIPFMFSVEREWKYPSFLTLLGATHEITEFVLGLPLAGYNSEHIKPPVLTVADSELAGKPGYVHKYELWLSMEGRLDIAEAEPKPEVSIYVKNIEKHERFYRLPKRNSAHVTKWVFQNNKKHHYLNKTLTVLWKRKLVDFILVWVGILLAIFGLILAI